MSQIKVSHLTFAYEGSYDNIFEDVSFTADTDWKLGMVGRNGKGKTTFLQLLMGQYPFTGRIENQTVCDYFPYPVTEEQKKLDTVSMLEEIRPDYEFWKICRELELLHMDAEVLYRPFETLSHGERTKVMLAVLFSGDHHFLLLDEPTNHLDQKTREVLCGYLQKKKGFLLVSHDRWFLDQCIDHILVLNRESIVVEKGNFSSWWENKMRQDAYEQEKNRKLKGDISKMTASARRTKEWALQVESKKIGFDPVKEHDRSMGTRAYVGEKSRRMEQRRKNLERRQQKAIQEKETLLRDLEEPADLKLKSLVHHKEVYIRCRDLSLAYGGHVVTEKFGMELKRGERIVLQGNNGCGKSTLLAAVLESIKRVPAQDRTITIRHGILETASGLDISYISQDTSFLKGRLEDYVESCGITDSLFKAVLRQLAVERVQFDKPMEEYSEGQRKKVLIATSLLTPAHLYVWDEPLNYIDVFSRMQLEKLILAYEPAMLLVEHDEAFARRVGTKIIRME